MKLRIFWDDLRTSLWFRPLLWLGGLGLLALVLIKLDEELSYLELYRVLPWLFIEGADGARTMLGTIGSAMLTVATLAFSVIMLAVVQTANAYSPRILRQYLADTSNQHVLGILIGTFLYSLLVLRVVRSTDEAQFVPTIAVTVGIALTLAAVLAFIYFVNHVAHSIEVSAVADSIRVESLELLDHAFPRREQASVSGGLPERGAAPAWVVPAMASGYVEAIGEAALVGAATRAGGVIQLERAVGEYALRGSPLATLWCGGEARASLEEAVQNNVTLGKERTMVQDLAYGLRQLADMALRAISPAVNDPSTAVNVIDVLASILVEILERPPAVPERCDDEGALRLVVRGPTFETMLDLAFNQIRQYAAGDYACTLRLLEVFADLAYVATRAEERSALWKHVVMVARSADGHLQEPWDRADINGALRLAAARLDQPPEPLLLELRMEYGA